MNGTHVMILIALGLIFYMSRLSPPTNLEVWTWTDYRGKEKTIKVHREVH